MIPRNDQLIVPFYEVRKEESFFYIVTAVVKQIDTWGGKVSSKVGAKLRGEFSQVNAFAAQICEISTSKTHNLSPRQPEPQA